MRFVSKGFLFVSISWLMGSYKRLLILMNIAHIIKIIPIFAFSVQKSAFPNLIHS